MALNRHQVGEGGESLCGQFSRKFVWDVDRNDGPGLVVQCVERWFGVHQVTTDLIGADVAWISEHAQAAVRGTNAFIYRNNVEWWLRPYMSPAAIDNYVRGSRGEPYATLTKYWEAWYIPKGRSSPVYNGIPDAVAGDFDDEFSLCSIVPKIGEHRTRNTTRGKFLLTATATFHPIEGGLQGRTAGNICQAYGFTPNSVACAGVLPASMTAPRGLPPSTSSSEHTIVVRWDSTVPEDANRARARDPHGLSAVISHAGSPTLHEKYW